MHLLNYPVKSAQGSKKSFWFLLAPFSLGLKNINAFDYWYCHFLNGFSKNTDTTDLMKSRLITP